MTYVDLTPKWVEILPTWLMMYRQAIKGDCTAPDLVKDNATKELTRMAQGADKFNALVAWMKDSEGWSDETIEDALAIGNNILAERSKVEQEA